MEKLTIRDADKRDAEELSLLIIENALYLLKPHYTLEQWTIFKKYYSTEAIRKKIETQKLFCALSGSLIIGCIGLQDDFVVAFYTRLTHRKTGVGKLLMDYLTGYARNAGRTELQLAASPEGLGFYLKDGWLRVRDIEMDHYGVLFKETLMMKKI